MAILGKARCAVSERPRQRSAQALPFDLQGIDSDNGSEFINDHLVALLPSRRRSSSRGGGPYKKDDNAHIEQKNWTHVRKLMGWDRYDTEPAVAAMNGLYRGDLRLLQNLFLPSVKLVRKERVGSRTRRRYDAAKTPFERVLECKAVRPMVVARLKALRERLDPFALSRSVDVQLERIHALAKHPSRPQPDGHVGGTLWLKQGGETLRRKADDPRVVRARDRGSCGQPGASFSRAGASQSALRPRGRLYASQEPRPSPPHPLSQRRGGTASKRPVEAAAPDAGMDAPSKSSPLSARPHPLGKRCAFPTGAWTRFARPPLPQAPPPRLHLSCLDEGAQGYLLRWLDRPGAPGRAGATPLRRRAPAPAPRWRSRRGCAASSRR